MINFFQKNKHRIAIFLAVFGPATITAISDNDAAGVATYSLAGAKFGYSILFILIFITVLLAITQEMGVRIATVTGKGLGDLIRERYGIIVSVFVFFALSIANLGSVVANFSALKAVFHMFNLPVLPMLVAAIVFCYLLVGKGNYHTNQRVFLLAIILYFSYIFSAFKAHPNWNLALSNLFYPTGVSLNKEYIFGAIAVLGTTITPWGQFFVHSFVIDKKMGVDKLKYAQLETYFGAFLTDFFTFFMIVATAATLFTHKISLVSGEQAALAIRPFAGELAGILFGIGLINAALMGIIIISLTTAYAFSEFFGYEGSLDSSLERGKLFYGIFIFQLIISFILVMMPSISLFKIVFYTQSLNSLLLPFVLYFLLKITNNKDLMGEHTNNRFYNVLAIFGSITIVVCSSFVIISAFLK
ncbi:Mn transporter [Candidatus Roizmanbacteria bacterium CG_4_10_14_0_8_um_filter_36_36]|uniref:Mn transporter n=1 Tax=Candidatus Roizmanbacteria bacterium CG_4_9_14_0_2_um_filter_36_12 TaxID=1974837 RepID=A0A2M8F239_9BACT|nr:MAG: Mn transporter [Candidatus Roizmanbacteria bacterium CG_4_10_14_0_8_um_filter_36_36]PJC33363.1 MAG: Mn transporter [Candidatus Roizmanbacteria bacterium CG_4_9_14_0_2_um_filter_36_12]